MRAAYSFDRLAEEWPFSASSAASSESCTSNRLARPASTSNLSRWFVVEFTPFLSSRSEPKGDPANARNLVTEGQISGVNVIRKVVETFRSAMRHLGGGVG